MARTYRSESAANAALAHQAHTMEQTRADWRAVLSARDAKRAARRASINRHQSRRVAGFASLAYMVGMVGMVAIFAGV